MHITPENIGSQAVTDTLGKLFVSRTLQVDPNIFTYSRERTESADVAQNGILITFKPDAEATAETAGGWRLFRFKGLTLQETNSSLHLLRRIANRIGQSNIDNDKPPSSLPPYTHDRFIEMIRTLLVSGQWTNSASGAWPGGTWETNQLYTWRGDMPEANGIITSLPFNLFTTTRPFRTAFRFTFAIFDSPLSLQPYYEPMFNRKARKWGRSLTERWEDEHRQLVDHRKFERNRKKVIVDPASIGTGKRNKKKKKARTPLMEGTLLNSILNRGEASAKRAALKAASTGRTAVRKHIEKRGAKKVQSAVKKALRKYGTGPAESLKKKPTRKGSR